MRGALLLAIALALSAGAPLASAQLPDALRSSRLTVAQEQELTRRLGALQGRFSSLAQETALREDAVRNIAIEIFGAQPGLDFDAYAGLIDSGARSLRGYIADAQNRRVDDPIVAGLRQQAVAAAEAGRLTEARALYDQLIAAGRANRTTQRAAEDLADGRELAESARLAYVSADFLDAARRYGQAAALAPPESNEREYWYLQQVDALLEQGYLTGAPQPLLEAVAVVDQRFGETVRAARPRIWALAHGRKASVLRILGETSDPARLRESAALHRELLGMISRDEDPEVWANLQEGLASALARLGERGDTQALHEAIAANEAALSFEQRGSPVWAALQNSLGASLRTLGMRTNDPALLQRAITAFEAALRVTTRETQPRVWASTMNNLAAAYQILGRQGDPAAMARAIASYEALLPAFTEGSYEWAIVQYNLGTAYHDRGADDCGRSCLQRAIGHYEASYAALDRAGAVDFRDRVANDLAIARRAINEGE
ncbi:MAG: hypothetical protein AB7P07_13575 [Hyphomonadaceae bacterium]